VRFRKERLFSLPARRQARIPPHTFSRGLLLKKKKKKKTNKQKTKNKKKKKKKKKEEKKKRNKSNTGVSPGNSENFYSEKPAGWTTTHYNYSINHSTI
jgi:hypothetical protein